MIIAIITAKIIAFFLHLFNKGATTLPGKIALKMKYNILTKLSRGVKIICVTGTNGKTTTCALIAHALKSGGFSYFINGSGANMLSGVTTSFIMNSTLTGRCKKEFAILECDENSLPLISRYIDAEIVAVTNIFRDQLDRYGEISHTLCAIKNGIENMPGATLILNADDPVSFSLSSLKNKCVTFGVNADLKRSAISDGRYCPVCKSELKYKSRTFAQLGGFYCTKCNYRRRTPDYEINDISNNCFMIDGRLYSTSLKGAYNLYNFCAAYAVLSQLKAGDVNALCSFSGAFGRMESFKNGSKTIVLLLVKNPVGLSECIRFVSSVKGEIDIAFALNDNEADGKDVSWIWDSDFTPLLSKNASVTTLGKRSADMALRLKYDSIIADNILDGEAYRELIKIIKSIEKDYIVFASYTAMMNMRHLFISEFGGHDFWKTK